MFTKLKRNVKVLLAHRRLPFILPFVSLLLVIGSIGTGLQLDDYQHKTVLQGPESHHALTDMFTFIKNPQQIASDLKRGMKPWWISENLRLSFFRPLSAATHWLDYQLWPESPALMHLHNLLWFMAFVFCAALLYRKLMTPMWVAGLAALLFALDDAHGLPAGWIANRNILIAGVFGFLSIYFHLRLRLDKWRAGGIAAPLFFLLSLLSAEAGVATGAYLIAFELVIAPGTRRRKVSALLPYLVVGMGWWITYKAMGYGAYGSGAYIDPGQDPITFIFSLFVRIPFLLYGQWLFPDLTILALLQESFPVSVFIFVYTLSAVILWVLAPLLKRNPVSRFWATGMVLALLPASTALPNCRLLVFVGLGGMGILALLLASWLEKASWLPVSKLRHAAARTVVILFMFIHLVAAPITMPFITSKAAHHVQTKSIEAPIMALAEQVDFKNKTIVLLNALSPLSATYFPKICRKHDLPEPLHAFTLAGGLSIQMTIRRIDDHVLEIELENGFLASKSDLFFRKSSDPMQIGQTVDMGEIRAQVLTLTKDQRPLKVRFSFAKSLDDPTLLFCRLKANRYEPFTPPQKGKTVVLKRTASEILS